MSESAALDPALVETSTETRAVSAATTAMTASNALAPTWDRVYHPSANLTPTQARALVRNRVAAKSAFFVVLAQTVLGGLGTLHFRALKAPYWPGGPEDAEFAHYYDIAVVYGSVFALMLPVLILAWWVMGRRAKVLNDVETIDLWGTTNKERVDLGRREADVLAATSEFGRKAALENLWAKSVEASAAADERRKKDEAERAAKAEAQRQFSAAYDAGQRDIVPPTGPVVGLAERWRQSVERYVTVSDEYTAIITDPLAALDHASLLLDDVSQPRTAVFLSALGRAQDRYSVLGQTMPSDATTIAEFEDITREVVRTWDEARRYAKREGYEWLPEAEQVNARRAHAALARAQDERNDIGERINAAEYAAKMLRSIKTVMLPEQAAQAIEDIKRLAIEA